ncbi:MAG: hypothetical protein RBR59_03865 [Sulfurimonadaceae bacterium]|jgi:uncharacterized protein YoxC|nr:hypothetical protein [Sulfurimonadaceae bacterium]
MDNELLTLFVGIIAVCMVLLTVMVAVIGLQAFNTMKKVDLFIINMQNEVNFLFTKAALTMNELQEMTSYIHIKTKSLAYKASNGIAKITLGTLVIDTLFNIFQKTKTK